MNYKYYLVLFSLIFLSLCFILNKNVTKPLSHQDIDSKAYLSNAQRFFNTNSFFNEQAPGQVPYFALGYAFFVGIVYKIFGVNNDMYVLWLQVLLALLTGFLIFATTKLLFGEKSALIAFAFFAFNLGFIVFSQFLLTETLLAFLLTLFLYLFVLFLKNQNYANLFCSGLVLGLSIAVKPAAIYFIFFLILFLLFFVKKSFVQKLKFITLLCVAFYLPVVGYMFFNKLTFDHFVVAPLGDTNLYFYFFPKVIAQERGITEMEALKFISSLDTTERKELLFKQAKERPFLCTKIWMQNVAKTLLGLFTTNLKVLVEPDVRGGDISFFKAQGNFLQKSWEYISGGTSAWSIKLIGLFEAFWTMLRWILCLLAFVFLITKKEWATLFLFLGFIFYFSMITGHDGCARFRMMFESALIILSAGAFAYKGRKYNLEN